MTSPTFSLVEGSVATVFRLQPSCERAVERNESAEEVVARMPRLVCILRSNVASVWCILM